MNSNAESYKLVLRGKKDGISKVVLQIQFSSSAGSRAREYTANILSVMSIMNTAKGGDFKVANSLADSAELAIFWEISHF